MPFYYYFDPTMLLILPAILFALWAQMRVQTAFHAGKKVQTPYGMNGYAVARRILDENGLDYIRVEEISGELTDHYDPKAQVIRLSGSVWNGENASAVGVAAHEAGHAVQYAENYGPIRFRMAIIPVCNIGSRLAMPLFLIGWFLNFVGLMWAGIIFFGLTTLFQLVTLPVEFDASHRAMKVLRSCGEFDDKQIKASRKVLTAAALTYVAALFTSLVYLLRYVLLAMAAGGKRRR